MGIEAPETQSKDDTAGPAKALAFQFMPMVKELGPRFYAAGLGVLYVSGFLVFNSNLAHFGILDIEFLKARYLVASISFMLYLACFYVFAGRAVLFGPKWLGNEFQRARKLDLGAAWNPVIFIHSYITSLFFACLSAAMFTGVAIGASETQPFYAVLAAALGIQYTFDVTNLDVRYPRITRVLNIILDVAAIYVFFKYSNSKVLMTVFWGYVALFLFINMVADQRDRYKVNADWQIFTGIYAIVVLFGGAIAFGSFLYGQVRPALGGGKPQVVFVGLTDAAKKALPSVFNVSKSGVLNGDLVDQTPAYSYFVISGHTIRLRTADVIALISTPESAVGAEKLLLGRDMAPQQAASSVTSVGPESSPRNVR